MKKEKLNPENESYIFKETIHGKGLPMWVNRTLMILNTLSENFLDKILEKDPKALYELYDIKTLFKKAKEEENKDLIDIIYNYQPFNEISQKEWLCSLVSLSDLICDNPDMTSEAFIYSLINIHTKDYISVELVQTSSSFEINKRIDENLLLRNDYEDINLFIKRKTYGKSLAQEVIKTRENEINKLSKISIIELFELIKSKSLFFEKELDLLNGNTKDDMYYTLIHLIKYYASIESKLECKFR